MPARPARAIALRAAAVKHRIGRLVGLGGLPQHKVERVVLAIGHRHALTGAQIVDALARQLAVARKLAHREVHIAAAAAVGQAFGFERADHRQHLRHVIGGTRLEGGRHGADGGQVLAHRRNHLVGERADGDAALDRALDDLVFDVGDVAHISYLVATGLQPAADHIEGHHHPGMAHVAQVVDRHAANVHAHLARDDGREALKAAGQRIEKAQRHRPR